MNIKRIKTITFVLALAAIVASLSGCEQIQQILTPEMGSLSGEIPIGAVLAQTGPVDFVALAQRNAFELAVEEINKSGFLGDAKIKLIIEDSRSTKEGAVSAFNKLIDQDKVVAILGPTLSTGAKAAAPIAQEKQVVVLGVSNTASGIGEIGAFIFRNSLPESAVIPNTVQVTKEKFGYQKVAVIFDDVDVFTQSGYEVFKEALNANGVDILTTETLKTGDTDFSIQLTRIKELNPDALIISALPAETVGILVAARELGIPDTVPFIGGNGFNSPVVVQRAGPAAEGAISGAAWIISSETPGSQAFVESYRAKYGVVPDQFAAQAYAGVFILAEAIRNANTTDFWAIRDALAKTTDLPTILGQFSFDQNGDPIHIPIVQVVKNGKFEVFK